jgi:hypothetical protein
MCKRAERTGREAETPVAPFYGKPRRLGRGKRAGRNLAVGGLCLAHIAGFWPFVSAKLPSKYDKKSRPAGEKIIGPLCRLQGMRGRLCCISRPVFNHFDGCVQPVISLPPPPQHRCRLLLKDDRSHASICLLAPRPPEAELSALRRSVGRGSPFGDESWTARAVDRLGLATTIRLRGRPKISNIGS